MPWTRARIALVACAAACGLPMVYVGFFQIDWAGRLLCPFASGCEAVALAPFSLPSRLASGLLLAALAGLIAAVVQMPGRRAAVALVLLVFGNLLAYAIFFVQMAKLGAWSSWTVLCMLLSIAIAALTPACAKDSERSSGAAGDAPVAPDDHAQQGQ